VGGVETQSGAGGQVDESDEAGSGSKRQGTRAGVKTKTVLSGRFMKRSEGFTWENSPLPLVMEKLADFKREYDRVAQIVMKRQAQPAKIVCWTQEHKNDIPANFRAQAVKQCKKIIPDGRWVFRDDGVFTVKDGVRVPTPAVCCSPDCYRAYQARESRVAVGLHRG
jgi:hypothetical protein